MTATDCPGQWREARTPSAPVSRSIRRLNTSSVLYQSFGDLRPPRPSPRPKWRELDRLLEATCGANELTGAAPDGGLGPPPV